MKRILVDIPFFYTAMIVPPRHRKPMAVAVSDIVTVAVLEEDPGDLVVAFRFAKHILGEDAVPYPKLTKSLTRVTDVLWDGKKLYIPFIHRGFASQVEWQPNPSNDLAWLEASPFSSFLHKDRDISEVPISAIPGRVISDERANQVSKISALAKRIISGTNGWLEETGEPVWELRPLDLHRNTSSRVSSKLLPVEGETELAGPKAKADRRSESLTWVIENSHPTIIEGTIEVLIPEAMTAPIADMNVISVARCTLKERIPLLYKSDIYLLDAWATLRDSIRGCERLVTPCIQESVIGYLNACAKAGVKALTLERAHNLLCQEREDGTNFSQHP